AMSAPTGWTLLPGTRLATANAGHGKAQHQAFYKIAGPSEPASFTFTQTNATKYQMAGSLFSIAGASTSAPTAAAVANNTASTACSAPSVTTAASSSLVLFGCAVPFNGAINASPPSGMTEDSEQVNAAGSYRIATESAHELRGAAGAT